MGIGLRRVATPARGWCVAALAIAVVLGGCGSGSGASSSRAPGAGSGAAGASAPTGAASIDPPTSSTTVAAKPLPPPTHTACRAVVYIGDSTSEGEDSPQYIPSQRRRLDAQLKEIGVRTVDPEISGARSIVETWHEFPNAATVAQQRIASGFRGCWVLALGTNDVADVAVGSNVGVKQRIARMMSIVGDQPVMWVNQITLVGSGPYKEDAMRQWNHDLLAACRAHPNMRVFDWVGHAKRRWFIPDGIHYYSPGYVARAHLISRALVKAYPRRRAPSATCVVS